MSHGFPSSFRDWAAEETDHPREVVEAALAHVVKNKVEPAYRRTDLFERQHGLMEPWAEYLADVRCAVAGRFGRRSESASTALPKRRFDRSREVPDATWGCQTLNCL